MERDLFGSEFSSNEQAESRSHSLLVSTSYGPSIPRDSVVLVVRCGDNDAEKLQSAKNSQEERSQQSCLEYVSKHPDKKTEIPAQRSSTEARVCR